MGLEKNELFLLSFMAFLGFTMGATVYEVGDSAGWTVTGNVDYGRWASSKTFRVNDTLLFKFDPQDHNVLQVSLSDFHSCDATAPMATYSTGNDSFFIRSPGHYFFFCGFLGHCQAGQKVDIRVPKPLGPVGAPIGSPIQPPEASPNGPMEPSPSSGESIICFQKIWLLLVFLTWDLF
ncbi:mavicyanin-like [Primulina huaijiensis]|uniref:mavicyanin-like n=1 Tax=Primulina huaijiensis TaxID=1492673 RepID=UPI003CC73E5D